MTRKTRRHSPFSTILLLLPLLLLLAACATGGGPAPDQPDTATPGGAQPAAADGAQPTAAVPPATAEHATADSRPAEHAAAESATAERAEAEATTAEPAEAEATPATPSAAADAAMPSSPAAAYLDDPAAIVDGRRMFRAVCTGYCHSTTPGVTKDAPNLFDCQSDHGDTDADLYRVITQGVPDTEMLPFEGKIPEDTIWKVIAYVRSNSLDCS